jgi:hypothetical protein
MHQAVGTPAVNGASASKELLAIALLSAGKILATFHPLLTTLEGQIHHRSFPIVKQVCGDVALNTSTSAQGLVLYYEPDTHQRQHSRWNVNSAAAYKLERGSSLASFRPPFTRRTTEANPPTFFTAGGTSTVTCEHNIHSPNSADNTTNGMDDCAWYLISFTHAKVGSSD